MILSNQGSGFIKRLEGCCLTSYRNYEGEPWTIGYGSTHNVYEGQTITRTQANQRFRQDIVAFETVVGRLNSERAAKSLKRFSACHFDALVSFAYNVGGREFLTSTVYAAALKTIDPSSASIACRICEYTLVNGKREEGIINRRIAEYRLYTLGDYA